MNKHSGDHFDTVAEIYNQIRPGYPESIYKNIELYLPKKHKLLILEAGAGAGKATIEIIQRWHPIITAIEPGQNFCAIMEKNIGDYKDLRIENTTFEDFSADEKYDCIISATAFHWMNKDTKYQKASDLLKEEGIIALYWNSYSRNYNTTSDEIDMIYQKYFPERTKGKDVREIIREKIESRKLELFHCPLFNFISHVEVITVKRYNSNQYIKLLKTFPENAKSGDDKIQKFYLEIRNCIEESGGLIDIPIWTNLEIAEKRTH